MSLCQFLDHARTAGPVELKFGIAQVAKNCNSKIGIYLSQNFKSFSNGTHFKIT